MKARIKATGEIVNLADYAKITLDQCDSWGNPIEVKPEEVDLLPDITEDEHWQDVRERAAIAAMQGMLSNPKLISTGTLETYYNIDVNKAINFADRLVQELKKKN